MKLTARGQLLTGVVLLALVGGGLHGRSVLPSEGMARALPWSSPLLKFWVWYPNEVYRDKALRVLLQAGPAYHRQAWEKLLTLNPPYREWHEELANAPGDLAELALGSITPDRPVQEQLAAEYVKLHRGQVWPLALHSASQSSDVRRRLAILSLLGDWSSCHSGQLDFHESNPLPVGARQQVSALYLGACQEAGLMTWQPPDSEHRPRPDLRSAPPEKIYEWIGEVRDEAQLRPLLTTTPAQVAERAAIELYFVSPDEHGVGPDRKMLMPYLRRALSRPMGTLCSYRLGSLELLGLAQAVPDSRLAQGCRAYGKVRGGTYFGDYAFWSGASETVPDKRLPDPDRWREWLSHYPDHPGADDASYWMGRAMERQGRRYEALVHFLQQLPHLPGDQDMRDRWRDHVLWLLDVGVCQTDLRHYLQAYPDDENRSLVRYALALRLARSHHYREALQLTENLSLAASSCGAATVEGDEDWSLERPDIPRSWVYRAASTIDEDVRFQRSLWTRCEALGKGGTSQALYELARFWSRAGGWRIGYCALLRGERGFLWRYSWDAYVEDSRPGFRPDADVIRDELRLANQNEVILGLMERVLSAQDPGLREKARYTRFAAFEAQASSGAEGESIGLRRDFYAEACREGRMLLRDFPGTSMADDVFFSLSNLKERPNLRNFLEVHFPEGDRY